MIAWAKLVVSTAWIMSASLACAGAAPKVSTPRSYYRSPSLDYTDGPRWASDGEVMGAHARAPDDWLEAGATSDHLGPGWSWQGWKLRFEPERAHAGRGAELPVAPCVPPPERPMAQRGAEAAGALGPAPLPVEPPLAAWVAAMAAVPEQSSRFLSCDER